MAIAFVNATDSYTFNPASTVFNSTAYNLTAGNLSVVFTVNTNTDVTSITDTAGNTYTQMAGQSTGGSLRITGWHAANVSGHSDNVVTAHYAADNPTYVHLLTAQYSGAATASVLDTYSTNSTGAGSTTIASTITTGQDDVVLVTAASVFDDPGSTWTADAGFTLRARSTVSMAALMDQILSSTQSNLAVTWSQVSAQGKAMVLASFKAAAAGGGGTIRRASRQLMGIGG